MQKYANRIFRKKEYSLLAQVPISVADFNALAVRNYEGTEYLQIISISNLYQMR